LARGRSALAAALLAWGLAGAATDPGAGFSEQAREAGDALAGMRVTLTTHQPYRFVLAYRGATRPFRGLICYGFAGYNETCMDPHLEWLTPATEIELYAPGGVPRDLLEGYVLEVRYPAISDETFRYVPEIPD
jgi:hypothetical protein